MTDFAAFFAVLAVSLFFSEAFSRLHLPWVAALIVAGIVIGPDVFGVIEPTPVLDFLANIGLIFLMFSAGLEMKFRSFRQTVGKIWWIALLNATIPFIAGLTIAALFNLPMTTALLVGVIFISSSIAVVIPVLEEKGLLSFPVGKAVIASTMLQDVVSLFLVAFMLQGQDTSIGELLLSYVALALILGFIRWIIPKIRTLFHNPDRDLFQQELRSVFVMLLAIVVIFELFGIHPIIAGFFAGLLLSDLIQSKELSSKFRAISYGLFIPVFFVLVGVRTPIANLLSSEGALLLAFVIIAGSFLSKFFSGFLGARLGKFSFRESILFGTASTPQLSTTLAVAFSAHAVGLVSDELAAAFVFLSLFTSLISPILLRSSANLFEKRRVEV